MADSKASAKEAVKPPLQEAVERGVERWVAANLRNTDFSRDTGAWNVLQAALPSLSTAILEEVG